MAYAGIALPSGIHRHTDDRRLHCRNSQRDCGTGSSGSVLKPDGLSNYYRDAFTYLYRSSDPCRAPCPSDNGTRRCHSRTTYTSDCILRCSANMHLSTIIMEGVQIMPSYRVPGRLVACEPIACFDRTSCRPHPQAHSRSRTGT